MKLWTNIKNWILDTARVMRRELNLSLTDAGALIFFILLPLAYPIVYTLIYNPEVAREIPVAVVDNSRTAASREFVRMADATESIHIIGYAANMEEARRWKNNKDCYAILDIPANYGRELGRGEQANITFYSDMSLLLRYRSMLMSMTNLQLAAGSQVRTQLMNSAGVSMSGMSSPVENQSFMLGDTEQGFASFIIPGIIILILQQSMILGITLLGGTSYERRLKNGGVDPLAVKASPSSTVIGRMLSYLIIYLPMTLYVLHYVPTFFSLPHIGSPLHYIPFVLPMLIASAFLGITLQFLVKEREMSFMVVVFTSVVFLFLSGLTWPRYAMSWFWSAIGDLIPAVWGMEGFIRINSNNATIFDNSNCYLMMWVLSVLYFFTAILATRWSARRARREATKPAR